MWSSEIVARKLVQTLSIKKHVFGLKYYSNTRAVSVFKCGVLCANACRMSKHHCCLQTEKLNTQIITWPVLPITRRSSELRRSRQWVSCIRSRCGSPMNWVSGNRAVALRMVICCCKMMSCNTPHRLTWLWSLSCCSDKRCCSWATECRTTTAQLQRHHSVCSRCPCCSYRWSCHCPSCFYSCCLSSCSRESASTVQRLSCLMFDFQLESLKT